MYFNKNVTFLSYLKLNTTVQITAYVCPKVPSLLNYYIFKVKHVLLIVYIFY